MSTPDRPACCPDPADWTDPRGAGWVELLTLEQLPAALAQVCDHTLAHLDTRRAHWDRLRAPSREPDPHRSLLDAEKFHRRSR